MNAVEKLLAEAGKHLEYSRDRLAQDEKWAELLAGLARDLPPLLPYTKASRHGYRADALLGLEYDALADVAEAVGALPPLPAVKRSGSCTSLLPRDTPPDPRGYGEKDTPVFGVWAEAENVTGPGLELCWFTQVGPLRCKVGAVLKAPYQLVRWEGQKRMVGGSVHLVNRAFAHRLTAPERVRWWSPPDGHLKLSLLWPEGAALCDVLRPAEFETQVRGD